MTADRRRSLPAIPSTTSTSNTRRQSTLLEWNSNALIDDDGTYTDIRCDEEGHYNYLELNGASEQRQPSTADQRRTNQPRSVHYYTGIGSPLREDPGGYLEPVEPSEYELERVQRDNGDSAPLRRLEAEAELREYVNRQRPGPYAVEKLRKPPSQAGVEVAAAAAATVARSSGSHSYLEVIGADEESATTEDYEGLDRTEVESMRRSIELQSVYTVLAPMQIN